LVWFLFGFFFSHNALYGLVYDIVISQSVGQMIS
jgi:hypothetical protein